MGSSLYGIAKRAIFVGKLWRSGHLGRSLQLIFSLAYHREIVQEVQLTYITRPMCETAQLVSLTRVARREPDRVICIRSLIARRFAHSPSFI